jgi:hypothetical protein
MLNGTRSFARVEARNYCIDTPLLLGLPPLISCPQLRTVSEIPHNRRARLVHERSEVPYDRSQTASTYQDSRSLWYPRL